MSITLKREARADQWLGEGHLFDGLHYCQPEVNWSAGREEVYFTYADLTPRNWISTKELTAEPAEKPFMGGAIRCEDKDGAVYWRLVYPFMAWSIKSEHSIKRDYRPVYLDRADTVQTRLFADFAYVEAWSNPLPPKAEFRVVDAGYGRGFRPYYMNPGDWLVREPHPDGERISVVSNEEMTKLRA